MSCRNLEIFDHLIYVFSTDVNAYNMPCLGRMHTNIMFIFIMPHKKAIPGMKLYIYISVLETARTECQITFDIMPNKFIRS